MNKPALVIGNKNYSSWSLRPWLLLRQAQIDLRGNRISLGAPDMREQICIIRPRAECGTDRRRSHGLGFAGDCEYRRTLSTTALWPSDVEARAVARAVSAEMHSGFAALRENMTLNCRKLLPGKVAHPASRKTSAHHCAMDRLPSALRTEGDFLFGRFSITDAMYAPVALRFRTYAVELDPVCTAMYRRCCNSPPCRTGLRRPRAETEVLTAFER